MGRGSALLVALALSAGSVTAGAEPVGHWALNEGAGTTAADSSGLGHHGTFVGSAPVWTAGVWGAAALFSRDGRRISIPDAPRLDAGGALTLAAWIRPARRDTQYLLKKGRYDKEDGYELSLSSSQGVAFVRFNQRSQGSAYKVYATTPYPSDGATWMHLAATWDGQAIRLYVNGALEAFQAAPSLAIAANDRPLSIGAQDDGKEPFDGAIDDVWVLDHAIGEAEIAALMAGGAPPPDADGDGVPDAQDRFPADPAEWADADGDGTGDNADPDDDGDGMPDAWEELHGFDPRDPSDASGDADGDGVSNLAEYLAGSEPRDQPAGGSAAGHWALDEGAGTLVRDGSGQGHDGSFAGAPAWVSGVYGGALDFGGSGARVVVPDAAGLDAGGALSVAAWIRPRVKDTQYLVKKARHHSIDGFELSLSSDGRPFVRFNHGSAGDAFKLVASTPYPRNGTTWMHLAATFDGQEIRIYANGLPAGSLAAPGLAIGANALALAIGAEDDGAGAFRGSIDDVRLYGFALSPDEIQRVMAGLALVPDSDGDGVADDADRFPDDPAEWADLDSDGTGDNADPDDDGDGMPDAWELQHGFDALDPADAALDADGDGAGNLLEYQFGTDPRLDLRSLERGRWLLDEAAGGLAADGSGGGNHGSLVGSPAWVVAVGGSGLELPGDGSRVAVPDAASLDLPARFSLSAWIRPRTRATQSVLKKGSSSADGYEIGLSSSGTAFARFNQASSGNLYRLDSTSSYPTDGATWMHLGVSYDGAEIRLYVNGLLEGILPAPGLAVGSNSLALGLGAEGGGGAPLRGAVDGLRLHGAALAANDWALLTALDPTPDADGDGVLNGADALPLDPSEWSDRDGDGQGDNADPDDDGDGMPDAWELQYGLDPLFAGDALGDADGDGVSNLDEYRAGSDPRAGGAPPPPPPPSSLPPIGQWGKSALVARPTSVDSGEKPQSKLCQHAGTWWAVFPDAAGTWLWRLDGAVWAPVLLLSSDTGVHADYALDAGGSRVHVLLFRGSQSQLASLQHQAGAPGQPGTYQPWTQRPAPVAVPLESATETATLALDSTGRLWVAYDGSSNIKVRYADPGNAYATWSSSIAIAASTNSDDIGAIVAFGGNRVGVMWSNQDAERFGFRSHRDGDPPGTWSADEVPAAQSALNVGAGMADDHINLAVASDGTLYAAVKTSYDSSSQPKLALLVRRPNGAWDPLIEVSGSGTRPLAILNEVTREIVVVYTSSESGGSIRYRIARLDDLVFGDYRTLISGSLNNPTSSKQNAVDEILVLAATEGSSKSLQGAALQAP